MYCIWQCVADTSGDLVRLRKGGTKVSQRSYQLAIINSILKLKGVSVSDWQGTSYLISDGKGEIGRAHV